MTGIKEMKEVFQHVVASLNPTSALVKYTASTLLRNRLEYFWVQLRWSDWAVLILSCTNDKLPNNNWNIPGLDKNIFGCGCCCQHSLNGTNEQNQESKHAMVSRKPTLLQSLYIIKKQSRVCLQISNWEAMVQVVLSICFINSRAAESRWSICKKVN